MVERILLVEDEPALARLLERYLARTGFQVVVCSTGGEALEQVRTSGWHSGVFDLTLPDMEGEALAAAFQEANPEAKIVLTSGLPPRGGTRRAFLQKPFAPAALVRVLRAS